MKAWLDIAVLHCPFCKQYYIDTSWYVIEMESDIECGHCKKEFNSRKNATDRVILECQISENGKLQNVKIAKTLKLEELSGS